VFVRRLLVLLLALALMPIAPPPGARVGAGGSANGRTAERSTSHGPLASITESLVTHMAPFRGSSRVTAAATASMAGVAVRVERARTLSGPDRIALMRQGSASVPLRL
jgi:hypothetical protein